VINAVEIGFAEGIKYVYAGGTAKELESYNHTYCPVCNTCLIKRYRQMNISVAVDHQGRCPHCGSTIAGIWNKDSSNLPDKSIPSPSSLAE
jgi:pyruvate formate lyase activating enzyme